ncbi:DUF1554 domain-containing protein [Leptospira licerasiae]|uniref:PF07588 family protein n=1 Tax=Leptospira licerasiae str. MMD4847 TaxID=1049971 RepID=A0ABN0HB40_9LEPT|nr:DUF1554 domain-containing protein [Leptospira licerasiae]EIE03135.1 PF07588 family protein [Leptospira licerasiae serovar Varillal str. VAR 010]EJZ42723.1 PF07588 family protein [Leptospira licerasiae str. MMD4847]
MKGSKSLRTAFILLCLTLWISKCNNAESTALDGSKPSIAGAITIDPSIFWNLFNVLPPYPLVGFYNEGETTFSVEENNESDITLGIKNPPTDGSTIQYRFYTSDNIYFVTDTDPNTGESLGYTTRSFGVDPQNPNFDYKAGLNINGAQDDNCLNNYYDLVAVDVESGISQTFKVKVTDLDKCIFVATNNGAGYTGNFAKKGIDNSTFAGPKEVADDICNSNVPDGVNKDVGYKAMLAISYSPSGNYRNPSTDWVFNSFSRYFSQGGKKLAYSFNSSTTIGFANADQWANALGTSGRIWTGFSSIDWATNIPTSYQCAGLAPSGAPYSSWYSSTATGSQGVLSSVNGNSIAEMTTTDPAQVIETACSQKRNIVCVGQ